MTHVVLVAARRQRPRRDIVRGVRVAAFSLAGLALVLAGAIDTSLSAM
jgi:hypothetical protein